MIKLVLLLRKKDGLTKEQFIDYYENRHVPFIGTLVGEFPTAYRRSYVNWEHPISAMNTAIFRDGDPMAGFDVVTEIWLKDEATMNAMFAKAQQPDIAKAIADDEENAFDRAATKMFITQEYPL